MVQKRTENLKITVIDITKRPYRYSLIVPVFICFYAIIFSDYQGFIWFKDIVAMSHRLKPGDEAQSEGQGQKIFAWRF